MYHCVLLTAALTAGCAHTDKPDQGVTTVVVEPPPAAPARRPLEGCPRVNPTCTYQALAVEFGRAEALPDHCQGRLSVEGEQVPAGRVRVEGLARLEGPASWDILQDLEALARSTLQTCYQEGLRVNPELAGAMELEFQVEAARSCVTQIQVTGSSVDDLHTQDCVIDALEYYPLPSAGSLMSARLVFEPAE